MISITQTGSDFKKAVKYLKKMNSKNTKKAIFQKYGRLGVEALAAATPKESGVTARSWKYEFTESGGLYKLTWSNTHVNKGVPIAIILQYGHGTGTGGYVQGIDYINPALKKIFNQLKEDLRREVTNWQT